MRLDNRSNSTRFIAEDPAVDAGFCCIGNLHFSQSGNHQGASATGTARDQLQGWIPSLATSDEIRSALDEAFDYRGDVTITLRNGQKIEGYIFDRRSDGRSLEECRVRMLPKDTSEKISIYYSDIACLEFTGRDTGEGKSFELWVKKYYERKASGQKNISLELEPLDERRM